jgi:hypothetical protein
MPNQHMRICKDCKFWESLSDESERNIQGTCHYWPPAQSQQIRFSTTEEVENPKIAELAMQLSAAKLLQTELISESKEMFDNYPVRVAYDKLQAAHVELQAARNKVKEGMSNISHLKSSLDNEKTTKPFIIKEILHTQECGVWPRTVSSDWCGQWREY